MIKYFINYEDFIEENSIDKNLSLCSPELFIIKKYKKKFYKFEPILTFNEKNKDLLNYAKKLNYSKKGILMVELSLDEANKFDDLLVKKYENIENDIYKKYYEKDDKVINLINFRDFINFSADELNKGTIVAMMSCFSNKDYMYISADRGKMAFEYSLQDRRKMLLEQNIGCDLYFHTDNETLLNRCHNNLTIVKEVDYHTYKIISHKIFVIDSINSSDIIDLKSESFYCLDLLTQNSIPVYIKNVEGGFELSLDNKDYDKKGYIINTIYIDNLLQNGAIVPLIKFINVYELKNEVYQCECLEKSIDDIKVLKYIKRKDW